MLKDGEFEALLEKTFTTVMAEGLGTGKVVEHARGRVGIVLAEDNEGRGVGRMQKGRPTYKVLTTEGQQIWWYQDRCTVLVP